MPELEEMLRVKSVFCDCLEFALCDTCSAQNIKAPLVLFELVKYAALPKRYAEIHASM